MVDWVTSIVARTPTVSMATEPEKYEADRQAVAEAAKRLEADLQKTWPTATVIISQQRSGRSLITPDQRREAEAKARAEAPAAGSVAGARRGTPGA